MSALPVVTSLLAVVLAALGLGKVLAVPRFRELAAAGVLLLLGGALGMHVRNGDGPEKVAPAAVTAALAIAYLLLLGAAR